MANAQFPAITTDFEFKYDSNPPVAGVLHQFFTDAPWILLGGATPDTERVYIQGSNVNDDGESRQVAWQSTRLITAVIIKGGGDGSNVYYYGTGANADSGLVAPTGNGISHISFCYGLGGGTTAGDGAISGRVVNSYGVGISNARMTLVDAATGETVTAITNGFGYYTIDNIAVGEYYTLAVSHKRYRFTDPVKAFTLNDSFTDVDFVANP